LPERSMRGLHRHGELQSLQGFAQCGFLRFTDQQMDVFRHDHVSGNNEVIAEAHRLQGSLEQSAAGRVVKKLLSPITAEGYEMKVASIVIPDQASGHRATV